MSRILVIGASGTVGSELTRQFSQQGHRVVRATSRPTTQPDAVHVDLARGHGIAAAFEGVERAFLLSPPGFTRQDELLRPLIEQARARQLQKVVLMSAMGANADPNAPLRRAEVQLEQSGVPFNIIRPNWFMQNFNSYWVHGIVEHGKIFLPVAQAKGSFIDARDIAAVAAALLTRDDMNDRDFDLTGARALDHDEVATILSREAGRRIVFEDIAPETMLQNLLAAGLPADYAQFMLVILGYFKAGYAQRVTTAVQDITGRAPISFEQYAREHRAAWAAAA